MQLKLPDVFKTVGLPPYTYVKPPVYGEVRADIEQPGRQILIEGPSGVGKTCVVYKVFEELAWRRGKDYEYISCRDADASEKIDRYLKAAVDQQALPWGVLFVDDFHLLTPAQRSSIGSTLKRLSDQVFEVVAPPKVIMVGIPTTGTSLLSHAPDLGPRLALYRLDRASDREVERLLDEGERALNVLFGERDIILSESSGNLWLAQYICNKVCATKEIFETQKEVVIVSVDLLAIRARLMAELVPKYMPASKILAKGRKWRPGGNKPYLEVFLALAKVPDSVVTFDKIVSLVQERRRPGIKAVRGRIAEVIHNDKVDLRQQIAFEQESGFSIEDPLFRYFLTNLDTKQLLAELGIEPSDFERTSVHKYDVAFSFAGETRRLVEAANTELKNEDVVTFYDFDQQAILLAADLETVLKQVYAESSRYYLVFLDKHYREKVWTKFEKDVMTRPGRKGHIIPVIVDDDGASGTVGIANTLGRIDLREEWSLLQSAGLTDEVRTGIRNKCVLPVLSKIDLVDATS